MSAESIEKACKRYVLARKQALAARTTDPVAAEFFWELVSKYYCLV